MNKAVLICLLLLVFAYSCGDPGYVADQSGPLIEASSSEGEPPSFVEGEILVKFRSGDTDFRSKEMHKSIGSSVKKKFKNLGIEHISLPSGMSALDGIRLYLENPNVEFAEPNYIVHKAMIANDASLGLQWGMHNTGQTISGYAGTVDADIDAPEAWDLHTGGTGNVVVAVIDTGVDYNHPDLADNIWVNTAETNCTNGIDDDSNGFVDDCRGWDFAYNDNNPMDDDVDGHGTHVAGIIGAIGNNAEGVSGVNWSVKIMPVKFLDSNGLGSITDAISAIDYASSMGAIALNGSYAYSGYLYYAQSESAAILRAEAAGALFIAAAGNNEDNNDTYPTYPASHNLPNLIAVAATTQNDTMATFSNYGASSVHVGAPGYNIYSTVRVAIGNYAYMSGTSMAAPHVTGLAALVASYRPAYGYREIREAILSTAEYKDSLNARTITEGRINAYAALALDPSALVLAPANLTAAPFANVAISLSWVDNSSNETGFRIERKNTSNGIYSELDTVGANTNTYLDASVSDGVAYYYRVRAYNGLGVSSPCRPVVGATTLISPDSLMAFALTDTEIHLTWNDRSSGETGFDVARRSSGSSVFTRIATLVANSVSYVDSGLSPGTTYYYKVRAVGTSSNSAYSAEASATTGSSGGSSSSDSGPCFIATAAYGSYMSPEVSALRKFRDRHLMTNFSGRAFVRLYYKTSPPIAAYIAKRDSLRAMTRIALTPVVYSVTHPFMAMGVFLGTAGVYGLRRKMFKSRLI